MPIPCGYRPVDRSKVVRQTVEAARFGRTFCATPNTETRTIYDKQRNPVPVKFLKDEPLP